MKWNEKIEKLMEQRGWTQKELSRESGITEASISRYLNGERTPRVDVIVNFAKAFNVSTDYLLYEDDNDNHPFDNISTAIARNGDKLTAEEQNKLIQLLFKTVGDKNVSKS